MLVIHGGPGLDCGYLQSPLKPLSDRYQLFFYDQRCLGRSEGVPTPQNITIEAFLQDIETLRQGLQLGPIHLAAHSWGCFLAMLYASQHPAHVRSMMLISPVSATYDGMLATERHALARLNKQELDALAAVTSSEPFLVGEVTAVNTFMTDWFRPYLGNPSMASLLNFSLTPLTAKNWTKVNAYLLRQLGVFNILPQLSTIQATTTVFYGDKDVVPKTSVNAIVDAIPSCQLQVLPGCGHFPFWETPEALCC